MGNQHPLPTVPVPLVAGVEIELLPNPLVEFELFSELLLLKFVPDDAVPGVALFGLTDVVPDGLVDCVPGWLLEARLLFNPVGLDEPTVALPHG